LHITAGCAIRADWISKSQRVPARKSSKSAHLKSRSKTDRAQVDFPVTESVGYQIRATHRALQRFLLLKIEPHGVTLGMWYFLRALWTEDGLTQRELSRRVGTMEPTTLSAIVNMERIGLVKRSRNKKDRRKQHVHLTSKGRALKADLIPLAKEVVSIAVQSLSTVEIKRLLYSLDEIQKNLHATISQLDEIQARLVE
jgi:MarR family transcriptional regulator, organic hydroperoxide resistance regulator